MPFADTVRDCGAEKGFAFVHLPYRGAYGVSGGMFDEIAYGTRVDRRLDVSVIGVRRNYEDFGGRGGLENLESCVQAIYQPHYDIHQDQGGVKLFGHGERLTTILGFTDDVKIGFTLD